MELELERVLRLEAALTGVFSSSAGVMQLLPGGPADGGDDAAGRPHNPSELAARGVGAVLRRELRPRGRSFHVPAPAAGPCRRRHRGHRGGLVEDQRRHAELPAGMTDERRTTSDERRATSASAERGSLFFASI